MARRSPERTKRAWIKTGFSVYYALFIVFIYGPMIAMFILSFQGRRGGTSFPMRGFSLYWWNKLIEPSTVGDLQGALGRSLVLGAFNPLLYYLILFKAYELLPAQEAQSLNYTWALTLTWLSVPLLGQRIGFRDIAAGLICYAGVLVIATRGEVWTLRFSDPLGVALALGSTVIWALYWIYNTRDSRDPIVRLLLNFACSLPPSFVYCLLATEWTMPVWPGLLGAVYIGLFEMGITYALWQLALQYAENTAKVSNLIFIAPFCSLVLIHFVLGEQILWSTMMGLLFIIAGLLYQQFGTRVHSTDP